ncbi:hypothetical protein MKW92_033193, partial [Papaver armeniacum]
MSQSLCSKGFFYFDFGRCLISSGYTKGKCTYWQKSEPFNVVVRSKQAEMFGSIWLERNGRLFKEKRRKSPYGFRQDKSLLVFWASVKDKDIKVASSISWSSWEALFL